MSELRGKSHPDAVDALLMHADQVVGWLMAGDHRDRDEAERFGRTIAKAREAYAERDLPELGYTSPAPGDEVGYWTLRVNGGGAFLMNAALALKWAAQQRPDGPMRGCFERLYEACGHALAAEDAKTGG
jgi:hypothetical protein